MIQTTRAGSVRVVLLDRPDRRNALTPEMIDALHLAVREPGDARALLLAGSGGMFCSGFDLALCQADPEGGTMRRLLAGLGATVRALRSLPIPVVVAAHGGAIAGGCALLGGGDVVVADRAAKIGYPVVRLGVSPAVSAPTLALKAGSGAARRLQLDPAVVNGAEAHRLGLIHWLSDRPEEVYPRALAIAQGLGSKPGGAMAATKGLLAEIDDALAGDVRYWSEAALATSLSLAGSAEERQMLRPPAPAPHRPGD